MFIKITAQDILPGDEIETSRRERFVVAGIVVKNGIVRLAGERTAAGTKRKPYLLYDRQFVEVYRGGE